ncbi:MarR family winged helix-turn-helix transcriptional regulator [Ideonella sp. BN130291]|uniref:MarR family winged helix-turn-helix transcriptional regulator n=1 Tax=Ideonella sp. BN130291 TaxID=3112940 RepID=UPI002E25653A|nr:MarR family transcriptional regulator [Ideonella sp. BN130291]
MPPPADPAAVDPVSVDSETRATADDHMALRLWLRLLACTNLIEAPLRTRLRTQFDGSLPRFDLMAQLDRHPDGLKMRELSRRLMVTGGNITGLTDKLVAEGLVERRDDPSDRRAYTVRLTAEGKRQFRTMARAHEGWVVDLLGGLAPAQQAALFDLLGELKRSLPPADPPA